jgi:hypothetical protein
MSRRAVTAMSEEWRLTLERAPGAAELGKELRAGAPEGVSVGSPDTEDVVVYGESRELLALSVGERWMDAGVLHRWSRDEGWCDPDDWTEPPAREAAVDQTAPVAGSFLDWLFRRA